MSEENQSPISEENQSPTSEENNTSVSDKELNDSSSSKSLEAIRARSLPSSRVKENPISSKEKQKFTHNEAINEYYRLKDKYESVYYEKYVKPIVKSNKSKREKRVEYSRLPKKECINCKRNVGTIFNITLDKEIIRKFTAKCGDLSDPCPLDIQITSSYNEQIDMVINAGLKIIEELKLQIIKEKNNVMFFYNKVSTNFDKLIEKLKTETENTGFVIENNILKNNNPEKEILLKKTIDEFSKELLLQFKQMINQYIETGDELVVDEAVKFYKNEMMPRIKEIQELKYEINMVEFDPEKFIFSLRQRKNSLQNLEYTFNKENKVVAFVKGTGQTGQMKNKTLKNVPSVKSKNKTRKSIMLVEEPETEAKPEVQPEVVTETQGLQEEKAGEYVPNSPEYFPNSPEYVPNSPEMEPYVVNFDNTIDWNNEEYKKVWDTFTSEEKELLLNDRALMKETLETLAS